MKRRSFFTRIVQAAAIVALAPQLAFRVKPLEFELRACDVTRRIYWTELPLETMREYARLHCIVSREIMEQQRQFNAIRLASWASSK